MTPHAPKGSRPKWTLAALGLGVLAAVLLIGTVDWRSSEAQPGASAGSPSALPAATAPAEPPAEDALEASEVVEAAPASGAEILLVAAPAQIGRSASGSWRDARQGDTLAPGETLRTGFGGRAELALDGNRIRLYENSAFRLPAGRRADVQSVHLDRGSSLFDVPRRSGRRHFEVHTAEAVAAVRGTRFGMTAETGQVELLVYEGSVAIWSDERPEVLVRAGFGAIGTGRAPFQVALLKDADPWDAWSQPTAGMPRIELGASLQEAAVHALERERVSGAWAAERDEPLQPEPAPAKTEAEPRREAREHDGSAFSREDDLKDFADAPASFDDHGRGFDDGGFDDGDFDDGDFEDSGAKKKSKKSKD